MARVQVGEQVGELKLPGLNGEFDVATLAGKRYLLSFFRFASCPFCLLRVHELITAFPEFGEHFSVVAIFDADVEGLRRGAGKQRAPFPLLADRDNRYYRRFAVERSWWGTLRGIVLRFPRLLYSVLIKGNVPFPIGGNITTMPHHAAECVGG